MPLDDFETASEFQLLDSNVIADGGFAHAHVLRSFARSTNRLVRQGEPLLSLSWFNRPPASTEDVELAARAAVNRSWQRFLPGAWVRPKKPGLTKADVFIHAQITTDAVVDLLIETLRTPNVQRADESAVNLLRLVGTGAMKVYKFRDIEIDPGPTERFAVHMRGTPGSAGHAVADVTNFAASNDPRGAVSSIAMNGRISVSSMAAWNTSAPTLAPAHGVVIHDGPNETTLGNVLYVGQLATIESSTVGYVFPPPRSADLARGLQRFCYITKLPTIRLAHLSIWANER